MKYLAQYGVESGRRVDAYSRTGLPSRDVGNANIAAIDALVYEVGFSENAPIFWWVVGGHDPLYAIFVAESEVDDGNNWGDYHFLAFSLTHAVLPFPVSLFAHDGMPWLIVKVPDGTLSLPFEGRLWRAERKKGGAAPPNVCNTLPLFDRATQRFAHELVEATTDPYPFFGWSGPTKVPVWTKSELSDICGGFPLPWAPSSVVASTAVPRTGQTQTAHACWRSSSPPRRKSSR